MRREELAHLLRAAARIADDGDILVVGSQVIGSFAEDDLPEAAWLSVEADLAFFDGASGQEKADKVDGAIGELSAPGSGSGQRPRPLDPLARIRGRLNRLPMIQVYGGKPESLPRCLRLLEMTPL
jgi:hypothetical protein